MRKSPSCVRIRRRPSSTCTTPSWTKRAPNSFATAARLRVRSPRNVYGTAVDSGENEKLVTGATRVGVTRSPASARRPASTSRAAMPPPAITTRMSCTRPTVTPVGRVRIGVDPRAATGNYGGALIDEASTLPVVVDGAAFRRIVCAVDSGVTAPPEPGRVEHPASGCRQRPRAARHRRRRLRHAAARQAAHLRSAGRTQAGRALRLPRAGVELGDAGAAHHRFGLAA